MRGKAFLYVLLALVVLFISAYLAAGPIITSLIEKEIKNTLAADSVSIGKLDFNFSHLSLKDIKIKKSEQDLKIEEVSVYYSLQSLTEKNPLDKVLGLDLKIPLLSQAGFEASDIAIKITRTRGDGFLRVGSVKYNKITLAQIRSRAFLEGNRLSLDDLTLNLLGGNVRGNVSLTLNNNPKYDFKLEAFGLNIMTLVNDLKLTDEFEMTGDVAGPVSLEGQGILIKSLDGNLITGEKGGTLIIKNKKFLENIAQTSNQSLDIIVESFKNYHYNKGNIRLFKDKGSLILDVLLDGDAGKRNLVITLHDFGKNQ